MCSYWKSLIDHSATILYKVWLGIHGKIDRPWASKHLSVAERMANLLMAEELGWSTLTFPRHDTLSYFQEQVRIMGFGGTCEKASNRNIDGKGHLTLGPLPTAASREPFQFHADKIFESSRPEYTQDPTLDVLIFLCRYVCFRIFTEAHYCRSDWTLASEAGPLPLESDRCGTLQSLMILRQSRRLTPRHWFPMMDEIGYLARPR